MPQRGDAHCVAAILLLLLANERQYFAGLLCLSSPRYDEKMWLVACHCQGCNCYSLQPRIDIDGDGNVRCECAGTAMALPGASYREADRSLFDAIVASLHSARVTSMQAARLALELEDCRLGPTSKLARLSELVPSLAIMELIATTDAATARTAAGMFDLLLQALSATNRLSDVSALAGTSATTQRSQS